MLLRCCAVVQEYTNHQVVMRAYVSYAWVVSLLDSMRLPMTARVPVVVAAMQQHRADASLVESGFGFLATMAGAKENKVRLMEYTPLAQVTIQGARMTPNHMPHIMFHARSLPQTACSQSCASPRW